MNVLTTEDPATDTRELCDGSTPKMPTAPVQLQHTQPVLSEPQEAFLRDRFSTKLEDPATGQWIRSWRATGG